MYSANTQYAIRKYGVHKLPPWLRRRMSAGAAYKRTEQVLGSLGLETICVSSACPNRGECWSRGTATVLILGNICTRSCRFCSVPKGKPAPLDPTEPVKIAEMAKRMNMKYLVITSVDRDDLSDGGAGHFRDVIRKVREKMPDIGVEILTPDFRGGQDEALRILAEVVPFVLGHNIETVPALYPRVRPGADYQRSLNLLKKAKRYCSNVETKSAIMLGLGEADKQVEQVLKDLRNVGCGRIAIGQYLRPDKDSLPVAEYIVPAKFDFWKQKAFELGFGWVMCSPFARSSFFAEQRSTL